MEKKNGNDRWCLRDFLITKKAVRVDNDKKEILIMKQFV